MRLLSISRPSRLMTSEMRRPAAYITMNSARSLRFRAHRRNCVISAKLNTVGNFFPLRWHTHCRRGGRWLGEICFEAGNGPTGSFEVGLELGIAVRETREFARCRVGSTRAFQLFELEDELAPETFGLVQRFAHHVVQLDPEQV